MNQHALIIHTLTQFDREQLARAQKNRRAFYNHYALAQYMIAADRLESDLSTGMSVAGAINANFNGALARRLHKALKTGDTDIDSKRRVLFNS